MLDAAELARHLITISAWPDAVRRFEADMFASVVEPATHAAQATATALLRLEHRRVQAPGRTLRKGRATIGSNVCDCGPDCSRLRNTAPYIYPLSSASISASDGMDGAVPRRVTEIPAVAHPKRAAETGAIPRDSADENPPTKASPAPVVSITGPAAIAGKCTDWAAV
jgi:hypothetical protein